MERTTSVLRNKINLRLQVFMTKYEPHSRSKIVMAVKAISLSLMVSNFKVLWWSPGQGTYDDQTLWAHKSKWGFV